MEWSTSVTAAITRCKETKSALLILIEPSPTQASTAKQRLSNLQATSLHKYLFTSPQVLRLVTLTNIAPVRLVADGNHDYVSFLHFFKHAPPPDMMLVSCNGVVLWSRCGFVSPRVFVHNVARVCGVDVVGWFPEPERSAVLYVAPKPERGAAPLRPPSVAEDAASDGAKDAAKDAAKDTVKVATTTQHQQPKDHEAASSSSEAVTAQPKIVNAPKSGMTLQQKKTKLQARLPNGESVNTSYPPQTPFHNIRTWLSNSSSLPKTRLLIATAFPRHVFDEADDSKSLVELGLCPSASLVVSDIGSDDVAPGVLERGWNAVAGIRGVVAGFVGSFFATAPVERGEEFVMGESDRDSERESARRVADDENLRYNGNSTQFGYDDNDR